LEGEDTSQLFREHSPPKEAKRINLTLICEGIKNIEDCPTMGSCVHLGGGKSIISGSFLLAM
jgi:hypothetical protein